MYLHIRKHTLYSLFTVRVSIDHRSSKSSVNNSPELKTCKCLSNKPCHVSALQPCNNAEVDTMIFLNLAPAAGQGRQAVYVLTDDSDIVVLAIYASSQHLDCQSFRWVSVVVKQLRDIPIHDTCSDLGPFDYLTLPLHAIKWCETTSHFLPWMWQED